jgi:diguanylate cyclase (GGDEF)-like protein
VTRDGVPTPRRSRSLISGVRFYVIVITLVLVAAAIVLSFTFSHSAWDIWSFGAAIFSGILIASVVFHVSQRSTLDTAISSLKREVAQRAETCDLSPLPAPGIDEIDSLVSDYNLLMAKAQQRLHMASMMETAARALAAEVDRDKLTGLYNRGFLGAHLRDEVSRTLALGDEMSVIMVDVDHFKHYNDTNGHPSGDEVLRTVAMLLSSNVRSLDACVRYGGEEFLVVLPRTTHERARRTAERIRAAVEEYPFSGRERQPGGKLTVSLGLASLPSHARTAQDLVAKADEALYAAKQAGRNRVVSAEEVEGPILQRGQPEAAT